MKFLNNDLKIQTAKDPHPKKDEMRIRVHAAGVNRADILQRQGKYPPPPDASEILGLEISGIVEELGEGVTQFSKNDRVMCLLSGGWICRKSLCT